MIRLEERQILRAIYPTTPNAEIAQRLGISVGMVMRYAYQFGLKKDPKYLSDINSKCGQKTQFKRKVKCNG